MTPQQQLALDLIQKINKNQFGDWFHSENVMAFVQVESAFRPDAYRREPSGVASYGLMQVLDTTAKPFGIDDPTAMFDPEISLTVGMKVARQYWDIDAKRLGRAPKLEEWCDSYNRGPGGSQLGSPDHAYVGLWMAASAYWQPLVGVVPSPAEPDVYVEDLYNSVVLAAQSLQSLLKALGLYQGEIDGVFGPQSSAAAMQAWRLNKGSA